MEWYVLDKDHNVVGPVSLEEGAKFFEHDNRIVAKTQVYEGCTVSTVFLGLDHRFAMTPTVRMMGDYEPHLFETLVFGGPYDGDGCRCGTWKDAEIAHAYWVDRCQPILTEG